MSEGKAVAKKDGADAAKKDGKKAAAPVVVLTPLQQLQHDVRLARRSTEATEPRFVLRALRKLPVIRYRRGCERNFFFASCRLPPGARARARVLTKPTRFTDTEGVRGVRRA